MKHFLTQCLLLSLPFFAVAQTQTIRGKVVDSESRMPIIGAAVVVLGSDPIIGTTTDFDGKFNLPNVKTGRVGLKITYLGYQPRNLSGLELNSGKELVLNVEMVEMVMKQEEVVVKANKRSQETLNTMTTVSARVFSTDEATRYAGTRNDVSRMATNFAGVRGANDATNDIVIRGNSPTGLLWRLEGVDIPNPNHFGNLGSTGGPVSMLNANVLSNSDFLTGAFPSEYGNGISGVFDLRMRHGNNEKHEFLGQIGFNGVEVGAEGPFSKKSGASYLVNFRYSTLALFALGGVDFGTGDAIPEYMDFSFKVRVPTKKAGIFETFGMGGLSSIDFIASESAGGSNFYSQGGVDIYDRTKTGVVGFAHTYLFKNNSYTKLTLAASTQINQDVVDSVDANLNPFDWYRQNFQDHRFQAVFFYKKKFSARHNLKVGTRSTTFYSILKDSAFIPQWDDFQTLTDFDGITALIQPYAQWQWRWNDAWTMNTGLHGQVLTLNGTYAIEPRWGLQWKVNPRHRLSLAYGLHSQMVALDNYFLVLEDSTGNREMPNRDLDFVRSHHVVLGYDWSLPWDMRIKLEAYYQHIYDAGIDADDSTSYSTLNVGSFTQDGPDNIINGGTGTNYGLELTFEKFLTNGYYWLLTASLYDSKYVGSDGVQRNTVFNGNYVVNVLGGYELSLNRKNPRERTPKPGLSEKKLARWNKRQERRKKTQHSLKFDIKFTLAGGARYTPIDLNASAQVQRAVYVDDRAYSEQFEPYYRLDLGVTYRMSRPGLTQEFQASCQNVTDKENPLYNQYDVAQNQLVNVNQLGIYPLLQYRILF